MKTYQHQEIGSDENIPTPNKEIGSDEDIPTPSKEICSDENIRTEIKIEIMYNNQSINR